MQYINWDWHTKPEFDTGGSGYAAVDITNYVDLPYESLDDNRICMIEVYSYFGFQYKNTKDILPRLREFRKDFYDKTGIYLILAENESKIKESLKAKSKYVLEFTKGYHVCTIARSKVDGFVNAIRELNNFYDDYIESRYFRILPENLESIGVIVNYSSDNIEYLNIVYDYILRKDNTFYISGNIDTIDNYEYASDWEDKERQKREPYFDNYFKRLGIPDEIYKFKLRIAEYLCNNQVNYDVKVNKVVSIEDDSRIINVDAEVPYV